MTDSPSRDRKRKRKWPLWKMAVIILLLFVLSPTLLLVVYNVPFVHPVSTLMVRDLVSLKGYDRRWLKIDDMAPSLVTSVMMSEDGQFCNHSGVDWGALSQVVSQHGGPSRGASTITMQLTKNLFLWPERSYLRKGVEIPLALISDTLLSKKRIMEIYLNIVEWGPGIYGAEAASQYYFKRSARNLTPYQSALLAVALPNPILRNPGKPGPGLQRLARLVMSRAQRSGAYIGCLQ